MIKKQKTISASSSLYKLLDKYFQYHLAYYLAFFPKKRNRIKKIRLYLRNKLNHLICQYYGCKVSKISLQYLLPINKKQILHNRIYLLTIVII